MQRKRRSHRKPVSSHPHWKVFSLSSAIALISVFIGSTLFTTLSTSTVSAAPLEIELGLPADHECGTETATFKVLDGALKHTVFKLNGVWHQINPCLEDLRDAAGKQDSTAPIYAFLYYQMLYVLSRPEVQFSDAAGTKEWKLKNVINISEKLDLNKIKRLIYLSAAGEAYDGMGQADMGVWAFSAYKTTVNNGGNAEYAAAFKAIAIASMETITAATNNKGLRTKTVCATKPGTNCSWFHSKTNDEGGAEEGRTLNKHLQIVRDLWDFGTDLRNTGLAEIQPFADKYTTAAVEGAHQLAYGASIKRNTVAPNLFDFVARKASGESIQRSWLFYGFTPKGNGYFLSATLAKNCGYHKRDISLLVSIFNRMGSLIDKTAFNTPPKDGSLGAKSILEFMVRAYEIKEAEGLYVDSSASEGGYFGACELDIGATITPDDLAYLRSI